MVATARKPKSRILPLVHDDRSSEEARVEWWKEGQTCWVKIQLADREFAESSERFYDALQKAEYPLEMEGSKFELQKYLNLLFDWDRRSNKLPLLHPDGSKSMVEVKWWQRAFKHRSSFCYVSINGAGLRSKGKRLDFFDALEQARLPFEQAGFRLLCYGASLNVFPSGMGRDCALGKEAYQMDKEMGTKEIFTTGKDVIPATVKEQRLFYLNWRDRERRREVEYDDGQFTWQIEPYLQNIKAY